MESSQTSWDRHPFCPLIRFMAKGRSLTLYKATLARRQPGFVKKGRIWAIVVAIWVTALLPLHSYASELRCFDLLQAPTESEWIDELIESDLSEIQKLFSEILAKHPMATSEYVFIGRSPSLLYAYLQAQSSMYSSLRSWVLPVSLTSQRDAPQSVVRQRFKELFRNFRNSNWPKDRTIVFIDFVVAGRTFVDLERLLVESEIETEFATEFVGFSHSPDTRQTNLNEQLLHNKIEVFPISFELEMRLGNHKKIAPYKSYRIKSADYAADFSPRMRDPLFEEAVLSIQQELFY